MPNLGTTGTFVLSLFVNIKQVNLGTIVLAGHNSPLVHVRFEERVCSSQWELLNIVVCVLLRISGEHNILFSG